MAQIAADAHAPTRSASGCASRAAHLPGDGVGCRYPTGFSVNAPA